MRRADRQRGPFWASPSSRLQGRRWLCRIEVPAWQLRICVGDAAAETATHRRTGRRIMSFHSRVFQLGAGLYISWIVLPSASADGTDTVQASTPEEVVSAILGANASGRTTEIHVAPGEYQFAETFASDDGPSLLPAITGTVLLIGKSP